MLFFSHIRMLLSNQQICALIFILIVSSCLSSIGQERPINIPIQKLIPLRANRVDENQFQANKKMAVQQLKSIKISFNSEHRTNQIKSQIEHNKSTMIVWLPSLSPIQKKKLDILCRRIENSLLEPVLTEISALEEYINNDPGFQMSEFNGRFAKIQRSLNQQNTNTAIYSEFEKLTLKLLSDAQKLKLEQEKKARIEFKYNAASVLFVNMIDQRHFLSNDKREILGEAILPLEKFPSDEQLQGRGIRNRRDMVPVDWDMVTKNFEEKTIKEWEQMGLYWPGRLFDYSFIPEQTFNHLKQMENQNRPINAAIQILR